MLVERIGDDVDVSIHALAKSATHEHRGHSPVFACFNPRAREERDRAVNASKLSGTGFNPRAREERDINIGTPPIILSLFQSTRSRRARRSDHGGLYVVSGFNPRAREERDNFDAFESPATGSFNPRAREERDVDDGRTVVKVSCFNPRAREERDVAVVHCASVAIQFQSTRSRRARRASMCASIASVAFQSTRSRRARPTRYVGSPPCGRVSIHALAKSATHFVLVACVSEHVSIHALAKSATWTRASA